jgi:exopolysaccharide biosynthesis polyprenyl glycosylphosphotransferase
MSNRRHHTGLVLRRQLRDVAIAWFALAVAYGLRFGTIKTMEQYWMTILAGGLALGAAGYVLGVYAPVVGTTRWVMQVVRVLLASLFSMLVMLVVGYLDFGSRVGRGWMGIAWGIAIPLLIAHHLILYHQHRLMKRRLAFLAMDEDDEDEFRHLRQICPQGYELTGVLLRNGDRAKPNDVPVIGAWKQAGEVADTERIDLVVFQEKHLAVPALQKVLSRLRYTGVPCMPITSLYEEMFHTVPLHLVDNTWFWHASSAPDNAYLRKFKRVFDIVVSLGLLILSSPILLAGMIAVRLGGGPGPLFFRQIRSGRFGQPFTILKLRTMRIDAEAAGPQWSKGSGDPRATFAGKWLRKYRVDEIPQLWNILRGEMSFVGPRPERPEFMEQLAAEIPLFSERLMLQPGLTGWAQVNYPYGETVDDARAKLEYDFYYLKHQGLLLDALILLDTVRVVLRGGLGKRRVVARREPGARIMAVDPVGTLAKPVI